jgi:hypothetical protein
MIESSTLMVSPGAVGLKIPSLVSMSTAATPAVHPFPVLYISKEGYPVVKKDAVEFESLTLTEDLEIHRCATAYTPNSDLVRWLTYSHKAANHIGTPFRSVKEALTHAAGLVA